MNKMLGAGGQKPRLFIQPFYLVNSSLLKLNNMRLAGPGRYEIPEEGTYPANNRPETREETPRLHPHADWGAEAALTIDPGNATCLMFE